MIMRPNKGYPADLIGIGNCMIANAILLQIYTASDI